MIVPKRKDETDEEYFARIAEMHKALGYSDPPPGWPTPLPQDGEVEQEKEDVDS